MNALSRLIPGFASAPKVVADVADAPLAARKRLAKEIDLLQTSNSARLAELHSAATSAKAKRIAADAALKAATEAENSAIQEAATFEIALNAGISRLEAQLRHTAPPAIEIAIAEWQSAWDRCRTISAPVHRQRVPATEEDVAETAAEIAAAQRTTARCTALMAAMVKAQDLKALALSPEELADRIAAINATVPELYI
jgi:hypothetical protein